MQLPLWERTLSWRPQPLNARPIPAMRCLSSGNLLNDGLSQHQWPTRESKVCWRVKKHQQQLNNDGADDEKLLFSLMDSLALTTRTVCVCAPALQLFILSVLIVAHSLSRLLLLPHNLSGRTDTES